MAAHLVDHEVVDVAQAFAVPAINGSAFHLVRCDQVVGLVPRQVVAIVVGTIALVAAAPALVIPIARAAACGAPRPPVAIVIASVAAAADRSAGRRVGKEWYRTVIYRC